MPTIRNSTVDKLHHTIGDAVVVCEKLIQDDTKTYATKHGPTHLLRNKRTAELESALTDLRFMSAYCSAWPIATQPLKLWRLMRLERAIYSYHALLSTDRSDLPGGPGLQSLATFFDTLGQHETARLVIDTAIRCELNNKTPDLPTILGLGVSLFQTQLNLGRTVEAENHLPGFVSACIRHLGPDHSNTLLATLALADMYALQGRLQDAEATLQSVSNAIARTYGSSDPGFLVNLGRLGALKSVQGHYQSAEDLLSRALSSAEVAAGHLHPLTLSLATTLARTYTLNQKYEEAQELANKTLEALVSTLGPSHYLSASAQIVIAEIFLAQGDSSAAMQYCSNSLSTLSAIKHPASIIASCVLAKIHMLNREHGRAERLLRTARNRLLEIKGPLHPDALSINTDLASSIAFQGRTDEAEVILRKTLSATDSLMGEHHPIALICATNLTDLFINQGRFPESDPLNYRIYQTLRTTHGPGHSDTLRSLSRLAWIRLIELGRDDTRALFEDLIQLTPTGDWRGTWARLGLSLAMKDESLVDGCLADLVRELGTEHSRIERAREMIRRALAP